MINVEIEKDHSNDNDSDITKFTNLFIKNITNNLENFSYNKIIANMHEMYSFLNKRVGEGYRKKTLLENYKKFLIAVNPVIPHLSSECLEDLKLNNKIVWPSYNHSQVEKNTHAIVIQINGKKRGLIDVELNSTEENVIKLIYKDEKITKYLTGNDIKRTIYIKNKILNIII